MAAPPRPAPGGSGEEPRSEVRAPESGAQSPPRERSEREEPFCFPPRQRAPLLTGLLEREESRLCSDYPTPSTANTQPNSPLPLNSSQPPAWGRQGRSKFALTTSGGGCIYSSLSSTPPSPRLLTLLLTRTININMCHCNRAGNIRILRWGGWGLGRRLGDGKKKMFHVLDVFAAPHPPTRGSIYIE